MAGAPRPRAQAEGEPPDRQSYGRNPARPRCVAAALPRTKRTVRLKMTPTDKEAEMGDLGRTRGTSTWALGFAAGVAAVVAALREHHFGGGMRDVDALADEVAGRF